MNAFVLSTTREQNCRKVSVAVITFCVYFYVIISLVLWLSQKKTTILHNTYDTPTQKLEW